MNDDVKNVPMNSTKKKEEAKNNNQDRFFSSLAFNG